MVIDHLHKSTEKGNRGMHGYRATHGPLADDPSQKTF